MCRLYTVLLLELTTCLTVLCFVQVMVTTTELEANFTVDVAPNTGYSLAVKTRPAEGGFWSEPATVRFSTQPTGLFFTLLFPFPAVLSHARVPPSSSNGACYLELSRIVLTLETVMFISPEFNSARKQVIRVADGGC